MKAFAELLDRLAYTPGRNDKIALLASYLRATPDPDRGWALAALTDGLPFSFPVRRPLLELVERHLDPELFRMSRDYVGDTAETVALIWPDTAAHPASVPNLSEVVERLRMIAREQLRDQLEVWLDRLDATQRWALLKLLTGGLRVGVSARLAKAAAAQAFARDAAIVEELWHGLQPPYAELFAWLEGKAGMPDISGIPVFRPLMLAHPLEEAELASFPAADFAAEWKWDGIRVQLVSKSGEVRLYSRTGDDISRSFPEIASSAPGDVVLDGELLVVRGGVVAPFNDLQQRLNRKAVTSRQMQRFPVHLRLYDALELQGEDMRPLAFEQRRRRLEDWFDASRPERMDLSGLLDFATWEELRRVRDGARDAGIEGLMLKRRVSPYLAGRPKGHWFKWKRTPLTVDCVMMYAQRGSGRRSSFFSDYTFGVWRGGVDGSDELVPVGKAYSGFTDAELRELDRWIRANTTDRFGPVRAVSHELVLEVAFDDLQYSTRHKSGVAMRFPRIHRIRWDKPAIEADRLETLLALIRSS